MGTKRERNGLVFDAYQGGRSACELAAEHGVSRQRVCDIVRAEARRRGAALRPPHRGSRPRYRLSPDDARGYADGRLSQADVAARLGCRPGSVPAILRRCGVARDRPRPRKRSAAAWAKYAAVYAAFMAGQTMREVAAMYHTTLGTVCQWLHRHRRATGTPTKYRRMK